MSKKWLFDSTVVLTGASSGIGKDMTKILIEKYNCKVIGIARNEQKMLELKNELGKMADSFTYKLFDVSSLECWLQFEAYLKENGIVPNILINNAGFLPNFQNFEDSEIDEVQKVMNVNFFSCIYSIKILMPLLLSTKNPAIINISSSASLASLPGTSFYSASKAALKSFTECLGVELKKKCYVGLICPGFVKTDIMRNQKHKTESKLMNFVSMKSKIMAKKIVRGIRKKRRRLILGFDAKAMDRMYRLCPKFSLKVLSAILKYSKISLFDDVFRKSDRQ